MTSSTSRLEDLPTEIFDHILGYVLCPQTTLEQGRFFRRYHISTAILPVNKAIYALAKRYLHYSISWIRLDLDWDTFAIDPLCMRIPYILIDLKEPKKKIPDVFSGDPGYRSVEQDVPQGRIHARIIFPSTETATQRKMRTVYPNLRGQPYMRVLVLEEDLKLYLACVRTNDLAYCDRNPSRESSQMAIGHHGISFDIRVTQHQQTTKYKHLIDEFKIFSGLYHQCTILGHEDRAHASHAVESIQLSKRISNGQLNISEHRSETELEAVSRILYLKCRGDELLRDGHPRHACVCYVNVTKVLSAWQTHNPAISFCTTHPRISQVFFVSIAINHAIAYVATGLSTNIVQYPGVSMDSWLNTLYHHVQNQGFQGTHRYLQVKMVVSIYQLFIIPETDSLQLLSHMEETYFASSTYHHDSCDCEEALCEISKRMRQFFDATKSISDARRLRHIPRFIQHLHVSARKLKLQPMKWAIHETRLPEGLRSRMEKMPKAHVEKGKMVMESQAFVVHIPGFNQPSDIGNGATEAGVRYLI
ncbi:hypothetical protein PtrV1_09516 [Pyrenophora tritici-repentis]|nr:hypothetical protein PtrV1_09516 [Pyrenophora tritici-repentis]